MDAAEDNTISGKISRALTQRIVTGELAAGVKLRQDHIAAEFNTSHVPVREALRRLEAQGLAVSEPRRGVRVASFQPEEMIEVAEMRAALEVLALRQAFPRIDVTLLKQATKAADDCDLASDVFTWEEANRRFHRLLVCRCEMPRLLATIDDLHLVSARFLFARWHRDWEARTDHDHRIILNALQRRDLAAAAKTLQGHVRRIAPVTNRLPA